MKMLLDSDFALLKFKEEKIAMQNAVLKGEYSFESLLLLMEQSQYADKVAWVMSVIVEKKPEIVGDKDVKFFLNFLGKNPSKAVERSIWRAFQFIEIPPIYRERCLHLAFETLENKESSIVVQIFTMSSAFELSKKNEDLRHLLREILLFKMETASKGFQSRARKILKDLI